MNNYCDCFCCCQYMYNNIPPLGNALNAYIRVLNYGGFVARFWGSYVLEGQKFNFQSSKFPIGVEKQINIPRHAVNIELYIDAALLPWVWINAFHKVFHKADEYCFVAYGVSFAPFAKQIPCSSPENML
ncbi:hypothetical protein C3495_07290 [Clostridiaceae bacterium 14S0207]|nr:hypothetical protein C3495_07290 [Clostridiaceae bacterium 14S0207]